MQFMTLSFLMEKNLFQVPKPVIVSTQILLSFQTQRYSYSAVQAYTKQ